MDTCTVEVCDRFVYCRGLCRAHYSRERRNSPLNSPIQRVRGTTCTVSNCQRPHKAKGYCNTHYYRLLNGVSLDLPIRYRAKGQGRITAKELRFEVITMLGGKCAHCGYKENYLGLDIDHINNDGAEQRRQLGVGKGSNKKYYQFMLDSGGKGLQVLCGTCHNIKTRS